MIELRFGDGAFPELRGKIGTEKVIHLRATEVPLRVGLLAGGMASGAHSASLVFDLPDGRTVMFEISAAELVGAARGIEGRIAFESEADRRTPKGKA